MNLDNFCGYGCTQSNFTICIHILELIKIKVWIYKALSHTMFSDKPNYLQQSICHIDLAQWYTHQHIQSIQPKCQGRRKLIYFVLTLHNNMHLNAFKVFNICVKGGGTNMCCIDFTQWYMCIITTSKVFNTSVKGGRILELDHPRLLQLN
jgi:hypothetical protein